MTRRWETEPWEVTPPGGEHLAHVQGRHQGQHIGLVIDRIPIALIKMRYQGLDPDVVRTLQLPNTYWEEIDLPW